MAGFELATRSRAIVSLWLQNVDCGPIVRGRMGGLAGSITLAVVGSVPAERGRAASIAHPRPQVCMALKPLRFGHGQTTREPPGRALLASGP
jgi:hypothetical protein